MADSGGEQTLIGWIKGLQALATEGPEGIVEMTRAAVETEMRANLDAGISPDGEAFAPLVEGGGKAYANAQKLLSVESARNSVVIIIRGALVFANWGTRKMVARKVLPTRGIPKKLGNAIRLGFIEMAEGFMSRRGRHDAKGRKTNWGSPKARAA
jgi:hypothetical protein